MPTDETTPPGDGEPAPAAKRARGLAALRSSGTRNAAAHARADGVERKLSRHEREQAMPRSVPIAEPDSVRAPSASSSGFDLRFEDSTVLTDTGPVVPSPKGRMHSIVETMGNRVMPTIYKKGWCPIPQHYALGRRGPMGGIQYSRFNDHAPLFDDVLSWAAQFPSANVAILLGSASHYTFAFDLDTRNIDIQTGVFEILTRRFGHGFLRFGEKGFVLIARTAPDVVVRNRVYRFRRVDGDDPDIDPGALEILGHGSLVTAYGHHHRTGDYFKWGGLQPLYASPKRAPLVSIADIEDALREIAEFRPFGTSAGSDSRGCSVDPGAVLEYAEVPAIPGAYVPRLALDDPRWSALDGRIVDGRRAAILSLSIGVVCGNGNLILGDAEGTVWPGILGAAVAYLHEIVAPGGARSRDQIEESFLKQIAKDVARLRSTSGDALTPWRLTRRTDGVMVKPARYDDATPRDAALSWLGGRDPVAGVASPKGEKERRTPSISVLQVDASTPEKKAARALVTDRAAVRAKVAEDLKVALEAFFSAPKGLHIAIVPTGAGKTVATTEFVVENARRFPRGLGDDDLGPIVVLMPNHATIDEATSVAQRHGAEFLTYVEAAEPEDQTHIAQAAAHARARGVKALHWTSKLRAGCFRKAEVALLAEAGVSSSGLCRSEAVADNGVEVERDASGKPLRVPCEWYDACGYQRMVRQLRDADVVYMSHWWLTAKLPKGLSNPRLLIIDESVAFQILRCAFLPTKALTEKRPDPHMRREDLKRFAEISRTRGAPDQMTLIRDLVAQLHRDRATAVGVVDAAREAGRCPAAALRAHPLGRDLLAAAKRLAGDAQSAGRQVHVRSTPGEIERLCSAAKSSHAALESRFWSIVGERMDALDKGDAVGDREMRIQSIKPDGADAWGWRVAWLATPNWPTTPTLMLDATAEVEVVRALFSLHGEPVKHEIEAPLNARVVGIVDRSYSPSSFNPRPTGDPVADAKARAAAERLRVDVQAFVRQTCAAHPEGQVLACTNKVLEESILGTMDRPANLVTAHYGALRGIDKWKNASAVVLIGRSEMPPWLLDGYVAALTYKTAPEEPFDRSGQGLTPKGTPLFRPRKARVVAMRTGEDLHVPVAEMPSIMAAAVERLWRESELQQALGRSRPIHRPDVADVIWMTDVVVAGVVYDDLLTLSQARAGGLAEPARPPAPEPDANLAWEPDCEGPWREAAE